MSQSEFHIDGKALKIFFAGGTLGRRKQDILEYINMGIDNFEALRVLTSVRLNKIPSYNTISVCTYFTRINLGHRFFQQTTRHLGYRGHSKPHGQSDLNSNSIKSCCGRPG